ncbi:Ribosomal-protein-S18p-alanine acetyltransferase [Alkalibacterium sp. AK22]|uniref:ribosomal protein S18-alanine N-acetyltransferase n=1 Tax=Alkalibacterium sp. AK22 TaxID=1229520 RepID=UPI000451252D|nr:ribosomal protein S18-alanine N-acetyltransferase [Alkalibacterium sp. AK22]EXJ23590.1 Ribosomal-protein-S18p-alanine acetyltransferase [Alkalibacterium sp. AK22]
MKNFKEWFSDRVAKTTTKTFVPLTSRIRLEQSIFPLSDEQFLHTKVAAEADVDGILAVERACYDGLTPWNRSAILHEIRFNKNAFYLIVYDHKEPVAFIGSWFVAKEAHITNIATIPAYQKKGIATYMLKEIINIAEKEDIKEVTLEVRVSNKTAQSLYETIGFERGRIKKDYYANDHEDALEMRYELDVQQAEREALDSGYE